MKKRVFVISAVFSVLLMFSLFCSNIAEATEPAWNIQTVDFSGMNSSLGLDSNGNPHISFTYSGNLMYASLTETGIPIIYPIIIGVIAAVVILAVLVLLRKRRIKKSSNLSLTYSCKIICVRKP